MRQCAWCFKQASSESRHWLYEEQTVTGAIAYVSVCHSCLSDGTPTDKFRSFLEKQSTRVEVSDEELEKLETVATIMGR